MRKCVTLSLVIVITTFFQIVSASDFIPNLGMRTSFSQIVVEVEGVSATPVEDIIYGKPRRLIEYVVKIPDGDSADLILKDETGLLKPGQEFKFTVFATNDRHGNIIFDIKPAKRYIIFLKKYLDREATEGKPDIWGFVANDRGVFEKQGEAYVDGYENKHLMDGIAPTDEGVGVKGYGVSVYTKSEEQALKTIQGPVEGKEFKSLIQKLNKANETRKMKTKAVEGAEDAN